MATATEQLQSEVKVTIGEQSATMIADEIERLADAAEAMLNESGLSRRAILVLLRDKTGLGMREIALVLDALPALRDYVR